MARAQESLYPRRVRALNGQARDQYLLVHFELLDQFSSGLRRVQAQLKAISSGGAGGHARGWIDLERAAKECLDVADRAHRELY